MAEAAFDIGFLIVNGNNDRNFHKPLFVEFLEYELQALIHHLDVQHLHDSDIEQRSHRYTQTEQQVDIVDR